MIIELLTITYVAAGTSKNLLSLTKTDTQLQPLQYGTNAKLFAWTVTAVKCFQLNVAQMECCTESTTVAECATAGEILQA